MQRHEKEKRNRVKTPKPKGSLTHEIEHEITGWNSLLILPHKITPKKKAKED
jgi:hypothetical protein